MNKPFRGTVEALLSELDVMSPVDGCFKLWVPRDLTFRGQSVPVDVAMAILLDKILGMKYQPNGFSEGDGGRLYKYTAIT
jgi:hypothetical protein